MLAERYVFILSRRSCLAAAARTYALARQDVNQRALDVAVIGAPNAGKSLLTNQIVRAAVCAVSSKMDTTTQNVDCIVTEDNVQLCVVDSPGTVGLKHATETMGRHKDDRILSDPEAALKRAQHILVVQDVTQTGDYIHHRVLHLLHRHCHLPSSLVLNKVDLIRDRTQLLELTRILCNGQVGGKPISTTKSIGRLGKSSSELKLHDDVTKMGDELWQKKFREIIEKPASKVPYNDTKRLFMNTRGWNNFNSVFFVSSLTGEGIDPLRNHLKQLSEEQAWRHDETTVTKKPPQVICMESIRAALLDTTPANVAYSLKPKLMEWNENGEELVVIAEIPCTKERVARLILGKGGHRINDIVQRVNDHMRTLFQQDIHVQIQPPATTFGRLIVRSLSRTARGAMSIKIDPAVYPLARKDLSVVDEYHGTKVADPYRWMEDPDAEETKKFVDDLNAISAPFINAAPNRDAMLTKLTDMWNFEKFGCTSKRGDFYYYFHNTGLQNQYVCYQQRSLSDKGTVFLDPNSLNAEGTTSLRMNSFSKDGNFFAYGLSEKGSDWVTIKFKTAAGKDLSDVVTGVKHSSLSWAGDNSGIFYCKYPEHKGCTEGTSTVKHEYHSLYFHKMGTDCSEDILVYERRDDSQYMVSGNVTEDGRFLTIEVSRGCDPYNMLYYYDLKAVDNKITGKIEPVPLFDKLEAKYDYIDHDENSMLLMTNKDAPMFRLVRVDLKDPLKVVEVIAEDKKKTLNWVSPLPGDRLLVCYLEDVKSAMYVYDQGGKKLYQIPLDIGSVSGYFAKPTVNEVFYQFESFLVPGIIYRMDFANLGKEEQPNIEELKRINLLGFDQSQFQVEQVFFESKDKTKVPMFIISSRDMVKDGQNPTILNGYGGFNIADTPYFSISRLLFAKHLKGIIACANLRGGSEYGEAWHQGGMRENKQNVFDDMQAAAEYLIREKYTSTPRLAIMGGSNGGLLMGACSQQRPDLFGAVINRVGVLDMLRFHKFTIGGAWVPEYGNPDDAEDFKFIYKYSPLHNIRMPTGGQWPSTLLMTADHDDRVVPSHTLKYAAQLYELAKQHAGQEKPLLARIEVKAGHGAGKPTAKIIEESVDIYSFLQRVLNLTWHD